MNYEIAKKYVPHIYFDNNEPFFPLSVGYSILQSGEKSPSFNRVFKFDTDVVSYVIEYAIYWDFDIQHLYEMEHIWVYVDKNEKIYDCEGSFHGKYLKTLLKNKENIEEDTHVVAYSQPGKHAFAPYPQVFELVPHLYYATAEGTGDGGLSVPDMFKDKYNTSPEIDEMVKNYMQRYKFKPSMEFSKYIIPDNILVTWEVLYKDIPILIEKKLEEMRKDILI